MAEQNIIDFLSALFKKAQIFLARPSVFIQVMTIIAILVIVSVVSGAIVLFIRRLFLKPKTEEPESEKAPKKSLMQYILPSIQLLIYPVLALISTYFAMSFFQAQGQMVGLLQLLMTILWIYLGYRFFLGILYGIFDEKSVQRFHWRLFSPLFGLFVLYQILNIFADMSTATEVIVTDVFDSPLTMGALFIATVGLYFWIDITWGLKDIIHALAARFTNVNTGRLEAALTLGSYILLGAGLAMSISSLGIDSTTFAAITAGLSVGFGFGMQSIVNNFVSGILLLFEGSINPGDRIEVNGEPVTIQKMGINSTIVKALNGYEYIVPNSNLQGSTVTTYTGEDTLRRGLKVYGVAYGSDVKKVKEILLEAMKRIPRVLDTPKPAVILINLGDSTLDFMIVYWVDYSKVPGFGGVNANINEYFLQECDKYDIEIPYPQQDIHFRDGVPWDDILATRANRIEKPEKAIANNT